MIAPAASLVVVKKIGTSDWNFGGFSLYWKDKAEVTILLLFEPGRVKMTGIVLKAIPPGPV